MENMNDIHLIIVFFCMLTIVLVILCKGLQELFHDDLCSVEEYVRKCEEKQSIIKQKPAQFSFDHREKIKIDVARNLDCEEEYEG